MKTKTAYKNMITKIFVRALAVAVAVTICSSPSAAAPATGQSFGSAREAVAALQRAAETANVASLREIFGPKFDEIANPDRVQATNHVAAFAAAMRETNRLVAIAERRM